MKRSKWFTRLGSLLLAAVVLAAACLPALAAAQPMRLAEPEDTSQDDRVNAALNRRADATSTQEEGGYYSIAFLTDGDWGTLGSGSGRLGWTSNSQATLQDTVIDLTVDLGKSYTVDKMVLKPMQWSKGQSFPRAFALQLSADGESWTTVQTVTDADASAESDTAVQPVSYSFAATEARWARIHITESALQEYGGYLSQLGEWEVWGVGHTYGKADLQAVLDEAKAIDTTQYRMTTVTVLNNAIAAAEELLAAEAPTEEQIIAAIEELRAAMAGLVGKDELENIALHQAITATSNYVPPEGFFDVAYLVDGEWETITGSNVKLGWNTDPYDTSMVETKPVDITISLDSSYAISKIVVKPMKWGEGEAFPRDYELQLSEDGESWTTVASGVDMNVKAASNTEVQPVEYPIAETRAKFFRMHITRHSTRQDASGAFTSALGELELFGYEDGYEIKPTAINKKALRMNPGETDWLQLNVDKHVPRPTVTYRSDNTDVVTVDADGTVHAVACGNAVITVEDTTNGGTFTCNVLVDEFKVKEQFQIVAFIPYFWEKDINPTTFDNLKAGGITNVEMNFALDSAAITYENNLKAIELAYERGLDVTVSEAAFTGSTWPSKTDEEILAFVKRYSHLPGVTGYYITDEPAVSAPFAHAMNLIKSVMPYAVTHMNYCGAYADNARGLQAELQKSGNSLDYIMYDAYVFTNEVCNEELLYSQLNYNRALSLEMNVPSANYIQSMSWQPWVNRPNADAIRYQVWADLAYGLKQISYFCWQTPRSNQYETYGPAVIDIDGNPTDLFEPVSKINAAVQKLGPTLMKLDAQQVYHTGTSFGASYNELPAGFWLRPADLEQALVVSRMTEKETGREYGMVVNRDYNNAQTVKFTVEEGLDGLQVISTETGLPEALQPDADGVYTVELEAGGGVLLQLPEDYRFVLRGVTNFYYLNKVIAQAEALDLTQYKPEGKEEFQAALAAAKATAANKDATQAEVDAAKTALEQAMQALKLYAREGVNLALHKNVEAPNSYEDGTYFSRTYLTDGVHVPLAENTHAGWSVDPYSAIGRTDPVDLTVDLEDEYLLSTVVLRPAIYNGGASFPSDYEIQVSTDGQTWTAAAQGKDIKLDAAIDQSYTLAQVPARYVRIHITRHSEVTDVGTGGALSQIGELEVYGTDIIPVDKAALKAAIDKAETADFGKADTTAVEAALAEAKAVYADENATQEQVDAAAEKLNAAIAAALKEAEGGSSSSGSGSSSSGSSSSGSGSSSGSSSSGSGSASTSGAEASSSSATTAAANRAPNTGDSSHLAVWAVLLALCALGCVLLLRRRAQRP